MKFTLSFEVEDFEIEDITNMVSLYCDPDELDDTPQSLFKVLCMVRNMEDKRHVAGIVEDSDGLRRLVVFLEGLVNETIYNGT